MDFVLFDTSNGSQTADGDSLNPEKMQKAATLAKVYMNRDYASEHGGSYNVRVGTSITDVLPHECQLDSQSTLVGAPGAIAFHANTPTGDAVAYDGVSLSDSLFGPGNSWFCAITHEMGEAAKDEGCNIIAIDLDGTGKAVEVADPVEQQSYPITVGQDTAYASNFVTNEYFIPNRPGPYDFMTKSGRQTSGGPPGPMQVANGNGGNYQIVYSGIGNSSQVTAKTSPTIMAHGSTDHRKAKKKNPNSRAARRGLKV